MGGDSQQHQHTTGIGVGRKIHPLCPRELLPASSVRTNHCTRRSSDANRTMGPHSDQDPATASLCEVRYPPRETANRPEQLLQSRESMPERTDGVRGRSRIGGKIDLWRKLPALGRTGYSQSRAPELRWRLRRFGPARCPRWVLCGLRHGPPPRAPLAHGGIEPDRRPALRSLKPTWELQPVT